VASLVKVCPTLLTVRNGSVLLLPQLTDTPTGESKMRFFKIRGGMVARRGFGHVVCTDQHANALGHALATATGEGVTVIGSDHPDLSRNSLGYMVKPHVWARVEAALSAASLHAVYYPGLGQTGPYRATRMATVLTALRFNSGAGRREAGPVNGGPADWE